MIQVVVADDSRTSRELLVRILEGDPSIQVVGEARDGREAVELAARLRPDVITMDILMPLMDGVEATREIMMRAPTRIIIVSSATRTKDVQLALDAMRAGAVMVMGKPDHPDEEPFERQRAELLSMVRAMSQVKVVRRWTGAAAVRIPGTVAKERIEIVTMAASTGGPEAVRRILSGLTSSFPAPILLVQHIAVGFTEGFAKWLDRACALSVRVAGHGEQLEPGTVYIAPDNRHLGLGGRGTIALSNAQAIHNMKPSANHLFRSAAHLGARHAAVILTGMGRDGVEGLAAVKAAGGRVIAQDESTSIVYGMPGEARAANLVDLVMPLHGIARQLSQWCGEHNG
jgi:two-component system chemotaxis response regulator CheB